MGYVARSLSGNGCASLSQCLTATYLSRHSRPKSQLPCPGSHLSEGVDVRRAGESLGAVCAKKRGSESGPAVPDLVPVSCGGSKAPVAQREQVPRGACRAEVMHRSNSRRGKRLIERT